MRRSGAILALLLALWACHDELPAPPSGLSIDPNEGRNDRSTQVTIKGDFVAAVLGVDLDNPESSMIASKVSAKIGGSALQGITILPNSGGVSAIVPPGFPAGSYNLVLVDAGGRSASLASAFTAIDPPIVCPSADKRCAMMVCGNGRLDVGEECDDSNTKAGDGCSPSCLVEPGFDCSGAPSHCSMIVMMMCLSPPANCGDGIVQRSLGEECDDGNVSAGDGCSACCGVEPGFYCFTSPSLCARQGDIAWVQARQDGCPGSGTMQDPYCHVQRGVDDGKPFVVIGAGRYVESVSVEKQVRTIIAQDAGVEIVGAGSTAFTVSRGSSVLAIGFTIRGSDGVSLSSQQSALSLSQMTIGPSFGVGVDVNDGAHFTIDRSIVRQNTGGGLSIDTRDYRITNTVVALNGNQQGSSTGSGVSLLSTSSTAIFSNNTVVDNMKNNGGAQEIFCSAPTAIVNSIIWQSDHGSQALASSHCMISYSLVRNGSGDTILNQDPQFVGSAYQISEQSPCVNAGDPRGVMPTGPAPFFDLLGARRPKGQRVDIGAYEVN